MEVVEAKLRGQLLPDSVGGGLYNCWYKNRGSKQGGGIIILIRKNIKVTNYLW